jgi:hypothetical protein
LTDGPVVFKSGGDLEVGWTTYWTLPGGDAEVVSLIDHVERSKAKAGSSRYPGWHGYVAPGITTRTTGTGPPAL